MGYFRLADAEFWEKIATHDNVGFYRNTTQESCCTQCWWVKMPQWNPDPGLLKFRRSKSCCKYSKPAPL